MACPKPTSAPSPHREKDSSVLEVQIDMDVWPLISLVVCPYKGTGSFSGPKWGWDSRVSVWGSALGLGSTIGWIMGSTLGSVTAPVLTPVPGLFPGPLPGPKNMVGVTLRLEARNPTVASYSTFILELEPLIPYIPPLLYVLIVLASVPVFVLFVVQFSSTMTVLFSLSIFLLR
jgi:hypothetical protein